ESEAGSLEIADLLADPRVAERGQLEQREVALSARLRDQPTLKPRIERATRQVQAKRRLELGEARVRAGRGTSQGRAVGFTLGRRELGAPDERANLHMGAAAARLAVDPTPAF